MCSSVQQSADGAEFCLLCFGLSAAVSAPLLLKAKETCNLSSETCAVLHQGLEQLSKQEEVGEDLSYSCTCHTSRSSWAFYRLVENT